MNDVTLVTITCSRDRAIQKLQSYTIDKFINEPCNHIVIIEDDQVSFNEWYAELSPYYTKHKLILLNTLLDKNSYRNDTKKKNGWHRSALLKLMVANQVHTDRYLLLDSKNFFIKPVNLDEWPCVEGNYLVEPLQIDGRLANGRVWPNLFEFGKQHNIQIPKNTYSTTTPFIVNTNIVKNLIDLDVKSLFLNNLGWSSELFLYSVYTQHLGNELKNGPTVNVTFWNDERTADLETLTDIFSWPNIKSFGVHRDFMRLNLDLTEMYNFLESIDFDKQLVETCFGQHQKDLNVKRSRECH